MCSFKGVTSPQECSIIHSVAVCRSVLQCVATCFSLESEEYRVPFQGSHIASRM